MNILVIGGGGREHALVWKLRQSNSVGKIWCAPGNGGISEGAECVPLDLNDPAAGADLAGRLKADLTIVGPEMPLVLGIANEFRARGLAILGPSREAARLEGSKIFSKEFLDRHKIPTARMYGAASSAAEALRSLDNRNWPLVIKADGLCAGKGVLVASSRPEAEVFIRRVMEDREFGAAGGRLLIEEGLSGVELSYIILTDGKMFIPLAPTRDHKRAFDGDKGPNTGGMGAYCMDELLPPKLEKEIVETVVEPTLQGLRTEGIPYSGFLYFGLMLTAAGPKVLEYNCRLGDPETEAILLRAEFDLGQACYKAATGNLGGFEAKWSKGASLCVVVASEGYPTSPITGREIGGLVGASEGKSVIFHAGTVLRDSRYYTSGGRVLVVAAKGPTLAAASQDVYDAIGAIRIEGSFYRKDIGVVTDGQKAPIASGIANH
jgi:phosphoribosylamine---glycine ligase